MLYSTEALTILREFWPETKSKKRTSKQKIGRDTRLIYFPDAAMSVSLAFRSLRAEIRVYPKRVDILNPKRQESPERVEVWCHRVPAKGFYGYAWQGKRKTVPDLRSACVLADDFLYSVLEPLEELAYRDAWRSAAPSWRKR